MWGITRRALTIVCILIFTSSLLSACGSRNVKNEEDQSKSKVTLTTVSMFGGTDPNAEMYQAINRELMEDYDYITIEDDSQVSDQDWKSKIAADFAVGNEPDVIQYFTDANASDVLAANKFVSIEEIRKEYPDYARDILDTALIATANPDGIQRAVPTTGFWEGLFCNKDLFDQYDLELPTSWDNMEEAIRVFLENEIIPIAVSLNNVPHYWLDFLLLGAAGSDGYTQIPTLSKEDQILKDWEMGLSMFKTLRDMGAFPKDTDTIDNDLASELFKNKEAAMQLEGSWYANGIGDTVNTVVCSFPIFPGGKAMDGAAIGGISSGFYITRRAWKDPDKRDAAVKFIMAHTSQEAVTNYWGGNVQAVSLVTPLEDMNALLVSGLEYSNQTTSISLPTDSRISREAFNTLIAGIAEVSTGVQSPEELLKKVLEIHYKK